MEFVPFLMVLSQFLLILIEITLCEDCKQLSACSCQTSKYTLDFSALGTGTNPRFKDIQDPNKPETTYDFQPCKALAETCGGSVGSVAVCQKEAGYTYIAGETTRYTVSGDAEKGTLKITYDTSSGNDRVSIVSLKCGIKGTADSVNSAGEGPINTYNFELTSHLLCPPGSGGGGTVPGKSGLSTGSVLLIIFFVLLIVYFIAGAVFLKYRRGAEGAEIIPNLEFWKSIPGLVKDGALFVFRGCKTDTYYSQI